MKLISALAGAMVLSTLAGCTSFPSGGGGAGGPVGKTIHTTQNVYPAIGPYSQMVQSGSTYYLSGVIPLNRAGNAVEGTTVEEQTRLVLTYIGEILKAQGMTHSNVVMSNVYMKDLNEFARMNAVYGEFFKDKPPSRATVEVARLPRDVKIEIAVIATK